MSQLALWNAPAVIDLPDGSPVIVCFGGGVDSTAMLCELHRAGICPDAITFADTGAEKPETYAHVRRMDTVLQSWGWPTVTWCTYHPKPETASRYAEAGWGDSDLAGEVMAGQSLPSLAFGGKRCSIKWKQTPQDYAIKGCGGTGENARDPHPLWIDAGERGVKPVKLIGYDAGPADMRRSGRLKLSCKHFEYRYPLQQLGMHRGDCIATITEYLGPDWVPLKSACYFCPASKPWELYWLAGTHPDLFMRALEMEHTAMTGPHSRWGSTPCTYGQDWEKLVQQPGTFPSVKTTVGMGRRFAWGHWARVHGIVNQAGEFIADRARCLAKADELRQADNALDGRSC